MKMKIEKVSTSSFARDDLVDPHAEDLSTEQIERVLGQHAGRFPAVCPAQLRGFGPENFLLAEDAVLDWYQVVATFGNAGGFSGMAYVANACNTWPALAREVLRLREENAKLERRAGEIEQERDDWESMAENMAVETDMGLSVEMERLLDGRLREFSAASVECMRATGASSVSLPELRAWWAQGKPTQPIRHAYQGTARDGAVCRDCGHEHDEFDVNDWCPSPNGSRG